MGSQLAAGERMIMNVHGRSMACMRTHGGLHAVAGGEYRFMARSAVDVGTSSTACLPSCSR